MGESRRTQPVLTEQMTLPATAERTPPEWLLRQADLALYASKGAGRNRVTHAASLAPPVAPTPPTADLPGLLVG